MAIVFVRHGETDWNRQRRFQSRTDVPLNETGVAQATRVREALARRGMHFAAAACSPLARARRTAEIILADTNVELVVDPAFIELDLGAFEGRLEAELRGELGDEFQRWRDTHYTEAAPGGENLAEAASRARPPLERLYPAALSADALVVGHQGINMAMKVAMSGRCEPLAAQSYRQANDEVDVWDVTTRRRVELFRV